MRLITVLTTALVLQMPFASAAEDAPGFRILSPEEIGRHLNAMEKLEGAQRGEYRDRIYAELRERARANGYDMPAVPPWKSQQPVSEDFRPAAPAETTPNAAPAAALAVQASTPASEPTPAPATLPEPEAATPAPDMQKLVAQQKQVIEEAVQKQTQERAEAQAATAKTAPAATKSGSASPEVDSYRKQMRKRFDDFLARREARQQQTTPPPATAQPQRPASPPAPVYPQQAVRPPMYPQPAFPRPPVFPQPAYPMQPGQPVYPQPAYPVQPRQPAYPPQAARPGYPPYGQRPGVPGWY